MVALLVTSTAIAPAKAEPWYCKAIKLMDQSCGSVRAYARLYGKPEAIRRARICGATEGQIAEAQACFTTK